MAHIHHIWGLEEKTKTWMYPEWWGAIAMKWPAGVSWGKPWWLGLESHGDFTEQNATWTMTIWDSTCFFKQLSAHWQAVTRPIGSHELSWIWFLLLDFLLDFLDRAHWFPSFFLSKVENHRQSLAMELYVLAGLVWVAISPRDCCRTSSPEGNVQTSYWRSQQARLKCQVDDRWYPYVPII
jgi:hypothetical protein